MPLREFEFEYEFEFEGEYEGEFEGTDAPRGRMTPPTLMRYLAREAERALSEDEAEAFVGALVPLAAQAIPRAAPAILRVAPQLISGLSQAASAMRRDPRTRPLVRQLPAVAQRTAASIARRSARGVAVTPATATRSLARQLAYQHSLWMRAERNTRGDAEYMDERPQRRRRRDGPFDISRSRPDTTRDVLRDTAQSMRRTRARLRKTTQDLRDARLPYAPTVPGQELMW